jgi:hypothetical protein
VTAMLTRRYTRDLYEYQPGNGTRYFVLATSIEEDYSGNTLAFMWLDQGDRGGRGMLVDPRERLDLAYFREKTGIRNEADAVALLCFLAEHFNVRTSGIPMHYRSQEWFQKAEWRGA